MSLDINIASTSNLLAALVGPGSGSAGPLVASGSLAGTASLLATTLDLKLVESVLSAIRVADLTSASERGNPGDCTAPAPTPQAHPALVIEPRVHYHLEPYFEPRPVFYYTAAPVREPCPGPVEVKVECVGPPRVPDCELPFQPPWKVLPWQNPPPVIQKVKVVVHRPDEAQKGRMIDLFI